MSKPSKPSSPLLDLVVIRARCAYRSEISGELEPEFDSREMLRYLAVIKALRAALGEAEIALASFVAFGKPSLLQGSPLTVLFQIQRALALVTGGTDA